MQGTDNASYMLCGAYDYESDLKVKPPRIARNIYDMMENWLKSLEPRLLLLTYSKIIWQNIKVLKKIFNFVQK